MSPGQKLLEKVANQGSVLLSANKEYYEILEYRKDGTWFFRYGDTMTNTDISSRIITAAAAYDYVFNQLKIEAKRCGKKLPQNDEEAWDLFVKNPYLLIAHK